MSLNPITSPPVYKSERSPYLPPLTKNWEREFGWFGKTIHVLRSNLESQSIHKIWIFALHFFAATFLIVSIIGIPIFLISFKEFIQQKERSLYEKRFQELKDLDTRLQFIDWRSAPLQTADISLSNRTRNKLLADLKENFYLYDQENLLAGLTNRELLEKASLLFPDYFYKYNLQITSTRGALAPPIYAEKPRLNSREPSLSLFGRFIAQIRLQIESTSLLKIWIRPFTFCVSLALWISIIGIPIFLFAFKEFVKQREQVTYAKKHLELETTLYQFREKEFLDAKLIPLRTASLSLSKRVKQAMVADLKKIYPDFDPSPVSKLDNSELISKVALVIENYFQRYGLRISG